MPAAYLLMRVEGVDEHNHSIHVPRIGIFSEQHPTTLLYHEEYVELMRTNHHDEFEHARSILVEAVRERMHRSPFWTYVAHQVLGEHVRITALRDDAQKNPRGVAAAAVKTVNQAPMKEVPARPSHVKVPFARFIPMPPYPKDPKR